MKTLLNILIIILALTLLYILIYPQYQEGKVYELKIGVDNSVGSLIPYLAEAKGFFQGQKLKPVYFYSEDPDYLYDKLLSQEIDLAVLPWSTVLKRVCEKNESVKVFISSDFRTGIPVDGFFIHPKEKIKSLKDLKGKKLGIPPALKEIVPIILTENGVKPTEVLTFELPQSEILNKIKNHELAAGILWEPYRTQAIKEGLVLLLDGFLPKSIITPYPGCLYALNPLLFRQRRRVAIRIKIATDMAITIIDKEAPQVRKIFLTRLNLDPEQLADFNLPEFQKLTGINEAQISSYLLYLVDKGVIDKERTQGVKIKNLLAEPVAFQ